MLNTWFLRFWISAFLCAFLSITWFLDSLKLLFNSIFQFLCLSSKNLFQAPTHKENLFLFFFLRNQRTLINFQDRWRQTETDLRNTSNILICLLPSRIYLTSNWQQQQHTVVKKDDFSKNIHIYIYRKKE